MENLLLILIFLVIIIFVFNHKKSKEAFQNPNDPTTTSAPSAYQNDFNILNDRFKTLLADIYGLYTSKFQPYIRDEDLITESNKILDEIKTTEINIRNMNSYAYDKDGVKLFNITNKLNLINNKINDLEKLSRSYQPAKIREPKTIKSLQNGLNLGLTDTIDGNYNVHLNNGCLKVSTSGDYKVVNCNPNDRTQKFESKYVIGDANYNMFLINGLDKVKDSDNIKYPFNLIKSSNTDFCLQNNHGNLTVEPCQVRKSQRWRHIPNVNSCDTT